MIIDIAHDECRYQNTSYTESYVELLKQSDVILKARQINSSTAFELGIRLSECDKVQANRNCFITLLQLTQLSDFSPSEKMVE